MIRRIRINHGAIDPEGIPSWFDDPEEVAPCPCGRPFDEDCLLVEGESELARWFHGECLGFLEYEMDDEEIEEKREWEQHVRRMQRGEEDDDA